MAKRVVRREKKTFGADMPSKKKWSAPSKIAEVVSLTAETCWSYWCSGKWIYLWSEEWASKYWWSFKLFWMTWKISQLIMFKLTREIWLKTNLYLSWIYVLKLLKMEVLGSTN
jgi:hypothetical protein